MASAPASVLLAGEVVVDVALCAEGNFNALVPQSERMAAVLSPRAKERARVV
jgi:hypothetical protein